MEQAGKELSEAGTPQASASKLKVTLNRVVVGPLKRLFTEALTGDGLSCQELRVVTAGLSQRQLQDECVRLAKFIRPDANHGAIADAISRMHRLLHVASLTGSIRVRERGQTVRRLGYYHVWDDCVV